MIFLKKKNWYNKNYINFVKLINDYYFIFVISEFIKMVLLFIDDRGINSFFVVIRRGLFLLYFLDRYRRKFLFLVYIFVLVRKKNFFNIFIDYVIFYICVKVIEKS